jgi:hypothetical protein
MEGGLGIRNYTKENFNMEGAWAYGIIKRRGGLVIKNSNNEGFLGIRNLNKEGGLGISV